MRTEYIQRGPSCDLDEHGDPKPPKYVRVTVEEKGPFVRRIRKPGRQRKPR
jgi:hypothetical protein